MRLAYFPGCKILYHHKDFGEASETLMKHLGVTLVRLPFNCCGNPARGKNLTASVLAAIKNICMAQEKGLDILTPCKCCFGQLKHGIHWYTANKDIREAVDLALAEEGMVYKSEGLIHDPATGSLVKRSVEVRHLLDLLFHDIGIEKLEKKIQHPLPLANIALQQGCHALRPFAVTQFDNPLAPKIFRSLVQATGLKVLDWSKETECCGDPVADTHKTMADKMRKEKQLQARRAGADYICTACTHCQIQYEKGKTDLDEIKAVPFAYFLGAALGLKGNVFALEEFKKN